LAECQTAIAGARSSTATDEQDIDEIYVATSGRGVGVNVQHNLLGLYGAGAAWPLTATQGGIQVQQPVTAPPSEPEGSAAAHDVTDDVPLAHGGRPVCKKQHTEAEYAIKRARKAENSEGELEENSSCIYVFSDGELTVPNQHAARVKESGRTCLFAECDPDGASAGRKKGQAKTKRRMSAREKVIVEGVKSAGK
jgi:hypothetical protein